MENVKEKEVHVGLTASEAAELLKSSKEAWVLCFGNLAHRGGVFHTGSVVNAEQIDPVMLSEPISPAHPHLKKAYTLNEGLQMLADARRHWDGPRLPAPGEVLTLKDEIARIFPTFARPMW